MSVINQVLNDLEKRGADFVSGESDILVVPVRTRRRVIALVAGGIVLGLVAIFVWWNVQRQPDPQPVILPGDPPAVAVVSAEAPAVLVAPQETQASTDQTELATMRLSYQLSAIPLPPAAKHKSSQKVVEPAGEIIKAPVVAEAQSGSVDKQMKQLSPQQQAENEFRRASKLVQRGRSYEALEVFEAALKLDPTHNAARQAMVGVLLESRRNLEAEKVLQEGLKINPGNSEFAKLLARLQVERNDLPLAMETLQKTLPYADQQADYHAFVAALYQRMNRHQEAINHFQIAVRIAPNSGVWLMGLGISMQELKRIDDARQMYQRAIESHTLNAELQAFVAQRLKEL